jgi:GTPase
VEAFKSTLELTTEADLLVHVVDSSCADPDGQIDAVRDVLQEIGASHVPELLVFNKSDVDALEAKRLVELHPGSVAISAQQNTGIDDFLQTVTDRLRAMAQITELLVPYERGDILAAIHREGEVIMSSHEDNGVRVQARLEWASAGKLAPFVVTPVAG